MFCFRQNSVVHSSFFICTKYLQAFKCRAATFYGLPEDLEFVLIFPPVYQQRSGKPGMLSRSLGDKAQIKITGRREIIICNVKGSVYHKGTVWIIGTEPVNVPKCLVQVGNNSGLMTMPQKKFSNKRLILIKNMWVLLLTLIQQFQIDILNFIFVSSRTGLAVVVSGITFENCLFHVTLSLTPTSHQSYNNQTIKKKINLVGN